MSPIDIFMGLTTAILFLFLSIIFLIIYMNKKKFQSQWFLASCLCIAKSYAGNKRRAKYCFVISHPTTPLFNCCLVHTSSWLQSCHVNSWLAVVVIYDSRVAARSRSVRVHMFRQDSGTLYIPVGTGENLRPYLE